MSEIVFALVHVFGIYFLSIQCYGDGVSEFGLSESWAGMHNQINNLKSFILWRNTESLRLELYLSIYMGR